jgi:molybdopterin molybdotransferase
MQPAPAGRHRAICAARRRKLQRGIVRTDAEGRLGVGLTGRQGSGILTSMSRAHWLFVLPEEQGTVDAGDEALVELLPWASVWAGD